MLPQLLTESTAMVFLHTIPVAPPKNCMKNRISSTFEHAWKKYTTIKTRLLHCGLPVPGMWSLMLFLIICSA